MSESRLIEILGELDSELEGYPIHVKDSFQRLKRHIADVHMEWRQEESTTVGIDYANEDD